MTLAVSSYSLPLFCPFTFHVNHEDCHLSIIYYRLNFFYFDRDKAFLTSAGMGEKEECFYWWAVFLRLLPWPLDGICMGCNLSAQTLWGMVAAWLFLYGNSDCLACCLSMDFDVLADGDKSKVKAWKGVLFFFLFRRRAAHSNGCKSCYDKS